MQKFVIKRIMINCSSCSLRNHLILQQRQLRSGIRKTSFQLHTGPGKSWTRLGKAVLVLPLHRAFRTGSWGRGHTPPKTSSGAVSHCSWHPLSVPTVPPCPGRVREEAGAPGRSHSPVAWERLATGAELSLGGERPQKVSVSPPAPAQAAVIPGLWHVQGQRRLSLSFQLSASSQPGPPFAAEAFLPLGVLLFIGISPSQLGGGPHCVRLCTEWDWWARHKVWGAGGEGRESRAGTHRRRVAVQAVAPGKCTPVQVPHSATAFTCPWTRAWDKTVASWQRGEPWPEVRELACRSQSRPAKLVNISRGSQSLKLHKLGKARPATLLKSYKESGFNT